MTAQTESLQSVRARALSVISQLATLPDSKERRMHCRKMIFAAERAAGVLRRIDQAVEDIDVATSFCDTVSIEIS